MKKLVLKSRNASGREQCVLDAEAPCGFLLGSEGDWRPVGFTGDELSFVHRDGSDWYVQALSGALSADGMPINGSWKLESPAVISCGSSWLIVDDELEPGAHTVLLQELLERHAQVSRVREVANGSVGAHFGIPWDEESTQVFIRPRPRQVPASRRAPHLIGLAGVLEPQFVPPSSVTAEPPLDETQVIDFPAIYASILAERARSAQHTRVSAGSDTQTLPPKRIRPKASRLAFWARSLAALAAFSCVLGTYEVTRGAQARSSAIRSSSIHAPATAKTVYPVAPPSEPKPSSTPPTPPSTYDDGNIAVMASPKLAANAFIVGEHANALSLYRRLSRDNPENKTYSLIVGVLTRRQAREGKP